MTTVEPTSETEAFRDRLLATSWQLLTVLEQLTSGQAQRMLAASRQADIEHATGRLQPLESWEGLPKTSYRTYLGGNNHVRVARLLDFLEPGDRVLDIGIGYGYVTSALVRTGILGSYVGIDLTQRFIDSARQGLSVNGLPDDNVHLEVADLYDLTSEWVARHDPTLVTVLEVLEHVPDTQKALDVLGSTLPSGCSVLFTVPMLGRLEGVWGHASVFDRARLEAMCAHSGLTIQYVEPLHNVWTLVLATTTPEVPTRLVSAARAAPPPAPVTLPHDYTFRDVELNGDAKRYRRAGQPQNGRQKITVTRQGVRCEVGPKAGAEPPYSGGLSLDVKAPGILRLDVRYDRPEGIEAVFADGYAGKQRVARWKWRLGPRGIGAGERVVHVLKPGGGGRFVTEGPIRPGRIERVEFYLQLKPEAREAAFTVVRAAYAGGWREDPAT